MNDPQKVKELKQRWNRTLRALVQNQHTRELISVRKQRPESPMVTLTWHACKYTVHELKINNDGWSVALRPQKP